MICRRSSLGSDSDEHVLAAREQEPVLGDREPEPWLEGREPDLVEGLELAFDKQDAEHDMDETVGERRS